MSPEPMRPGPTADAIARTEGMNARPPVLLLDQAKLARVVEIGRPAERGESIEGLTAKYFQGIDTYLGATDKQIAELQAQLDKLGPDAKNYATGLNNLRHITQKDADRVVGKQLAAYILEAVHLQNQRGIGTVTEAKIADKVAKANELWLELDSPTARAQVVRALRHMTTKGLNSAISTGLSDWTRWEVGDRRDEKSDFGKVMGETSTRLRELSTGVGAGDFDRRVTETTTALKTQVVADSNAVLNRVNESVTRLEGGIGIFSSDPAVQEGARKLLGEMKTARDAYTASLTTAQAQNELSDEAVTSLREVIKQGDTILTTTDKLIARAGIRGKLAGVSASIAERKAVVSTGQPGEWAIYLRAGLQIYNKLGLVDTDFRKTFGTVFTVDLNGIAQHIPLVIGERQAREVIRARAQEQLDAVHALMGGDFAAQVRPQLDIWLDEGSTPAQQLDADRALKAAGIAGFHLSEFRRDVKGIADQKEARDGSSDEMKQAWQALNETAKLLDGQLTALAPVEGIADRHNIAAVRRFAVGTLQEQLNQLGFKDSAEDLFDTKKWVGWVVDNTPGRFGKWLTRTAGAFRGLSPSHTTGVELDDEGGVKLSGIADRIGIEMTTLGNVVQATENPLTVALQNVGNFATLHTDLARWNMRNGLADAGERVRTILSKHPEIFGLGGTVAAVDTLSRTHAVSALGWLGLGAGAAIVSPFVMDGAGIVFQGWADGLGRAAEQANLRILEAQQWLQNLGLTSIDGASVSGPKPPINGDLVNIMKQAGVNGLEALKAHWKDLLNGAQDEMARDIWWQGVWQTGHNLAERGRDLALSALRDPLTGAGYAATLAAGMAGVTEGAKATFQGIRRRFRRA